MQRSLTCCAVCCVYLCELYLSPSQAISRAKAHRQERGNDPGHLDMSDEVADVAMDSDEGSVPFPPPTRGRGRGGRGRGGRGRGRGELLYYLSQLRSEVEEHTQW